MFSVTMMADTFRFGSQSTQDLLIITSYKAETVNLDGCLLPNPRHAAFSKFAPRSHQVTKNRLKGYENVEAVIPMDNACGD